MKHIFKQQSVKDLVRYNFWLLVLSALLSAAVVMLCVKNLFNKEQIVLVPANAPNDRLYVSSKGYSEVYLKEWATHVMQVLMTTSIDTVESQVAELKVISASSNELNDFFKKHVEFVKGSNVNSVFFPKKISVQDDAVLVSGHFRYWFGSSEKSVSQDKSYKLTYKRGPRNVLLLKSVVEVGT